MEPYVNENDLLTERKQKHKAKRRRNPKHKWKIGLRKEHRECVLRIRIEHVEYVSTGAIRWMALRWKNEEALYDEKHFFSFNSEVTVRHSGTCL